MTLLADGTTWYIDSSYYTVQPANNDIGQQNFSNRIGYGKTYVTDKDLANCTIGYGSGTGESDGGLRYVPLTGPLEININGVWQGLLAAAGGASPGSCGRELRRRVYAAVQLAQGVQRRAVELLLD